VSDLTIGDLAERTGVAEGTLRMWERRHGFPAPERLPSGHRRYRDRDVELVRRVASERAAGVALSTAIERALRDRAEAPSSLYARIRRRRPDLEPRTLSKPIMLALSRSIEDESLSRAERPLLFGSFQTERFYRQSRARWRELARHAELAIAFADFPRARAPAGGPVEIPVDRGHPLAREWAIVCDAPGHAVCLAGREPPPSDGAAAGQRSFEAVWSVEAEVVREVARIALEIAAGALPEVVEGVRERLDSQPARTAEDQLRLATAITNRAFSYLG
jgi:DNA-binding transcriptional MerR regulator